MPDESEPLVFWNGEIVSASNARLAIYDAGFVLGATVTCQARTFRHRAFDLAGRLERWIAALGVVGIESGKSIDEWRDIGGKLIDANARLISRDDDLGVLYFATPGEYGSYAPPGSTARPSPTLCVQTFRLPFHLWKDRIRQGVHLVTTNVLAVPSKCIPSAIKCRSRMHYYLAEREAKTVDPAAMALLLDEKGHLTETNIGNVLIVRSGEVVSPRESSIYPGHSRSFIRQLAQAAGVGFRETDLRVEDVFNADEVLLTTTPICLAPVTKFNGKSVGDGLPGPMYCRFVEAWSAAVGLDIRSQVLRESSTV